MVSLAAPLGLCRDGRNDLCLPLHPSLVHSFPWQPSLSLQEAQSVPPQFSWSRKKQFAHKETGRPSNEESQSLNYN